MRFLLFIFIVIGTSPASAQQSHRIVHRGTTFWVYQLDPKQEKLELFLPAVTGQPNTFKALEDRLGKEKKRLKFALNSGIYLRTPPPESAFFPEGLHISEGKTVAALNLKDFVKQYEGQFTDNFYLKPNGVFFVRQDGTAAVLDSVDYAKAGEKPVLATQSGPLLVKRGQIHPVFESNSKSRLIRNGVGVSKNGKVIFVCSDRTPQKGLINLYGFAELFRDRLDCPNALYLDGDISEIYIRGVTGVLPDTNWFAGIFAITEPLP